MPARRIWLLILVFFPSVLPAQPETPAIAVGESALEASGITPNAMVVWLGVARETAEYSATVVRRDRVIEDSDGDGRVRLELDAPVPEASVWIAVDLASGAWAAAAPAGSTAREVPLQGRPAGRGEPGRPDWIEAGRDYIEIAVVRPGQGSWAATLGDGGSSDEDGAADGRLTASLARMRSLGRSPAAPDRFAPGDVIAVVDPNRMEYYVETLAPGNP